jgi:hypothetical protein
MQSHCRLTHAHECDPLRCRQADKTLGGSNKTTKQNQNCCSVFFSSLLFSAYPSFPSYLPTYLLTYLSHPFFLTCLPTYLPTHLHLFLPTYCFILAIKSEPAVTNLLSFCVPQVFLKPSGGLYTDKGYNISVFILIYSECWIMLWV